MMQAACTRLIVWLGNERFHRMSFNLYAAEQHRAILALGPSFGKAELKTAYQGLIRQWHPDLKFGAKPEIQAEATEKTKVINVAYEFLSEVLDLHGGIYRAPSQSGRAGSGNSWSRADLQPKRTYEGKSYSAGFPEPAITEIFLKSSHIVSTAYSRKTQSLYIKFSGNSVYRYFDVPESVFEAFLNAPSHGKFGSQHIYPKFRQERY